jgi:glycine/D-amino acid oxidase-like deaminating enzyme
LTWYENTAERTAPYPPLQGTVQADVCVIGGGLAGLTTTLELARLGKHVVLVEAKRLAWGASGRNGGFVSNGFAAGIKEVEARIGLDAARELYRLSRLGSDFVRGEIAAHDPSILMGEGHLSVLRHDNAQVLRAESEKMNRLYGEDFRYLDVEETRALLRAPRYFQSLHKPKAFHIHPLRYALLLARLARQAGASLHENTTALSATRKGGTWVVTSAGGHVEARDVVHCVSCLDRRLHAETGRAVLPVATYVAVTAPIAQDVIRTRLAVADTRRANNYFRLVDEARIMWGGAITTKIREPARLSLRMKRDMVSVFPQLAAAEIASAWSGLMGYALHKMPLIGGDGQGQWHATAFGGHGLNVTAMAGILIARAIAEGDDAFRRFGAFAPRWAGGPFGRAGVQASYWWMQIRDRLDEFKSRAAQNG